MTGSIVFDVHAWAIYALDFLLNNTLMFCGALCAAVIVVARCLFEGGVR